MAREKRESTVVTKIFADRLSDLVEERKKAERLSHNQIAEGIGVASGSLSSWCSDEKTINISTLPLIADYFGVSIDWLLGLSEVRSPDVIKQNECKYTGLSEAAVDAITFDRTKCDHDGNRYLAFLNSLLVDPNFRYLITTLYRFTTANEAKTVYDKMNRDFDERKKKGEIEDHSEYTEEILRHAKRTDLHDEVRGMFLVQAKLNNLKSPIIQELARDVPDANVGDIYRLEAMRAFNDLLDEETGSPCFKKINP